MIRSIKFKNFQSFQDETEFSFELPKNAAYRGFERMSRDDTRVSTVSSVFGANASGKTALLKAFTFAFWFMRDSFSYDYDGGIPIPARILNPEHPIEIELIFDDYDGSIWKYELLATEERVLWEALYKKQLKFNYIFKRSWNGSTGTYEITQQGLDLAPSESRKVRQNASLISTALQYNSDTVEFIGAIIALSNVQIFGRPHYSQNLAYASSYFHEFDDLRREAVKLLQSWDIGLEDIVIEEVQSDSDGKKKSPLRTTFKHKRSDGSTFSLPISQESNGTQSAFVLLAILNPVLAAGGIAIIDEMESDLHPHLLESLLALFDSERTNPHYSQLIFTSHTTKVMDFLSKSQVFFVEKEDCVSHVYRGDQIKGLRSDDNLRAKYESGALGGLPQVIPHA
ncbi:AAA family ATPase [Stenotrophomonas maltophilia]|uniref:AAA family ATPase n=1 Tax=Stenotrophomonas maltophilia group sp. Smal13 TaxID=3377166 RepID=UPI00131254FA|nr:ATP-binding protein [Stenotrophomonas maltophilia]EKU9957549.1 ATP-binding protein [Stenotrophomonas maltophilia]EKU9984456.1 ATP-binding protein [Stenotrophomonas maltophilia]